ncbi:hypothetical protein ACSLNG_15350, partial [Escherichia fergusonii]|uniref:hypothetical protein n=1 Tax=Escherichia fergusonii TaxID=564 RepID=UPI003EE11431
IQKWEKNIKKNIHSYLTDGVIFSYFVAIEYPVEYWFSRLDKNDESIKIISIVKKDKIRCFLWVIRKFH